MDQILILLGIVLLFSLGECAGLCGLMGPGKVCNDELTGYYECNGNGEQIQSQFCDDGYMCGCGVRRRCQTEGSVCVNQNIPYVPKDFAVNFTGTVIEHGPYSRNVKPQIFTGTVWQDFKGEMMKEKIEFKENGKVVRVETELTKRMPNQPNFIKYKLVATVSDGLAKNFFCHAKKVKTFKDVFYNLRKRSYQDLDNPNTKYNFYKGRLNGGDHAIVEHYEYSNLNGQFSPRNYIYRDAGSEHSRTSMEMQIQYGYFNLGSQPANLFSVPSHCRNSRVN